MASEPLSPHFSLLITQPNDPHASHPNITTQTATLHQNATPLGTLRTNLLNKAATGTFSPNQMWSETHSYDAAHAPEAKLHKVENYLSNESFPPHLQTRIEAAEWVLYIAEAYIVPAYRGRGLSLLALDLLIKGLEVGEKCVVLLQAGAIVRCAEHGGWWFCYGR